MRLHGKKLQNATNLLLKLLPVPPNRLLPQIEELSIPLLNKLPCLASRTTPLLPLDDIYVTGALRERLEEPKVGLRLINSFSMGTAFFEWIVHCPFLGVGYYSVLQDVAYQRYHSYITCT